MKPVVVDASVAAKWFLPEAGSRAAGRLLSARYRLLAPDLIHAEFGNILWKAARRGLLAPDEAAGIAEQFLATPVETCSTEALLPAALEIALDAAVTVYDGLYVALAIQEGATCITADERLVRALAPTPFRRHVRLLGQR